MKLRKRIIGGVCSYLLWCGLVFFLIRGHWRVVSGWSEKSCFFSFFFHFYVVG